MFIPLLPIVRDAAVAAAVAALKSLKIPTVTMDPETEKITVSHGRLP
jgi:hypothetical protein